MGAILKRTPDIYLALLNAMLDSSKEGMQIQNVLFAEPSKVEHELSKGAKPSKKI